MKTIEKIFYVIKLTFLVILRINSNIHAIETYVCVSAIHLLVDLVPF